MDNEVLKLEAAEELGLLEKVKKVGWSNLSAQETGKIGYIVKKKMQQKMKERDKI
ncbi:MAG TPA: small, acid-soluble spore protein, alpha/beta type [Clostridia bacterium]|nr:small, acid-soluble spore protein, alpha/beta type [Clostridia bacterium]